MFDAIEKWLSPTVRGLEARIEALEADRLRYCGPIESGRAYVRGEVVTHRGSMWHCERATTSAPPGDDWVLCVKGGH
ncbi:MAG: hypothetical protein KF863_10660 [Rubrivivax sp.]|nr:hypothetical protein [Rubrivivax sp.]